MWPRMVEVMLALWLAISPFVFDYGDGHRAWWAIDLTTAAVVMTASLSSFWRRTHRAYLVTLAAALFLVGYGYFGAAHPSPAPMQNHLIVGLLLGMFAVLPSHNEKPPPKWMRFYAQGEDR